VVAGDGKELHVCLTWFKDKIRQAKYIIVPPILKRAKQ
jgi:hypothetical protein